MAQNVKVKILVTVLLFVLTDYKSQQNLRLNFQPLKSSGALPEVFTNQVREVNKNEVEELKKSRGEDIKHKSTFLTETNYEIEGLIRSGNVLMNDEVTRYL